MDTVAPLWLWIFFVGAVLAALFVDFVVLRKQGAHAVGVKEALNWSLVWVLASFAFNGLFWWAVNNEHGPAVANTRYWTWRRWPMGCIPFASPTP